MHRSLARIMFACVFVAAPPYVGSAGSFAYESRVERCSTRRRDIESEIDFRNWGDIRPR